MYAPSGIVSALVQMIPRYYIVQRFLVEVVEELEEVVDEVVEEVVEEVVVMIMIMI